MALFWKCVGHDAQAHEGSPNPRGVAAGNLVHIPPKWVLWKGDAIEIPTNMLFCVSNFVIALIVSHQGITRTLIHVASLFEVPAPGKSRYVWLHGNNEDNNNNNNDDDNSNNINNNIKNANKKQK
eukprot:6462911-Amphidinium_carterae.1